MVGGHAGPHIGPSGWGIFVRCCEQDRPQVGSRAENLNWWLKAKQLNTCVMRRDARPSYCQGVRHARCIMVRPDNVNLTESRFALSALEPLSAGVGGALQLLDAVADDSQRSCCRVAQSCVTGDLATNAVTFVAQHVAHALQFGYYPVNFVHRRASDVLD